LIPVQGVLHWQTYPLFVVDSSVASTWRSPPVDVVPRPPRCHGYAALPAALLSPLQSDRRVLQESFKKRVHPYAK